MHLARFRSPLFIFTRLTALSSGCSKKQPKELKVDKDRQLQFSACRFCKICFAGESFLFVMEKERLCEKPLQGIPAHDKL
jgi:hypothetical protein